MRAKHLEDRMGVREVAHGCHCVHFHCSVAGEVVSRQLMELYCSKICALLLIMIVHWLYIGY